jgi:effector-binding domain-containing protein
MKASTGDQLIVHGTRIDDVTRDAEILEARGRDGGPPYLVRWSDTGHETLFFPGPDASVHHFEHQEVRDDVRMVRLQRQPVFVVRGHADLMCIGQFLAGAFERVAKVLADTGVEPVGPPCARYRMTGEGFDIEAGFPVRQLVRPPGLAAAELVNADLPGGLTARIVHVGDYAGLGAAYEALEDWVVDNGYTATGAPWESYLDEPGTTAPRTVVYQPCGEPTVEPGAE